MGQSHVPINLDFKDELPSSLAAAVPAPDLVNPQHWAAAVQRCNPATLVVIIESRMGDLAARATSEDILQEALLRAWQARATVEWRGQRSFRSWLLTIIDHCISDARDWHQAAKRGSGNVRVFGRHDGDNLPPLDPAGSTTPSRLAVHRENAKLIKLALAQLPDDLRLITQLRLLEQRTLQQIADLLDLPLSTIQHRVRRGAAMYRDRLRSVLAVSSCCPHGVSHQTSPQAPSIAPPLDHAPNRRSDSVP